MSMKCLDNKIVVITGAGSGIGRSLAIKLANAGAHLALCDIDISALQQTQRLCQAVGARAIAEKVDVSIKSEMEKFSQEVLNQLGQVDVLINNAGIALSSNIETMQRQDFEWVFSINFWGIVNGCNAFLPQLRSRKEAHIVNLSSVFGLVGLPGQAAYCASKFAVRGFTDSLRLELTHTPINVTVVHPGGVRTNIIRGGRHYHDPLGEKIDVNQLASKFERLALTSPDQAADAIIKAVRQKKSRLLIGFDAYLFDVLSRFLPVSSGKLISYFMQKLIKKSPVEIDLAIDHPSGHDQQKSQAI